MQFIQRLSEILRQTMSIKSSLSLLVVFWSPGALFGEDARSFTNTLDLKNYVEQALKKSVVKRTDEMAAPLKFPLIVDGEKIKSLDEDSDGIYLTPEMSTEKATNKMVPKGRRYIAAKIRPNTTSLLKAKSVNALLITLCGNPDTRKCWSMVGKSIEGGVKPISSNTIFHLRYCYTTRESLNFLDVVFNTGEANSTGNQYVWIGKVTLTMVHAGGIHPEMDSEE